MQKGRFVVYPALAGARVDAATEQLRGMGAVVQVKPSAPTQPGPNIEPDAGGALGSAEFGGPVAHFSDADLGIGSGAFNTGAGAKVPELAPPPLFDQRGAGAGSPGGRFSPGGTAEDARTSRYEPVPQNASLSHEDMSALVSELHSAGPAQDDDMLALATGLDAAALESPSVQTIDGMDGDAFDAAEKEAAREAAPDPTPAPPPPGEEEDLTLDVDAPAGLTPVGPADGAVIRPQHPPEEGLQLDRPAAQSSASMSSPTYAAPRAPMSSPGMPISAVDPGERGLLFADAVANTLGLIAAACLVCVVVAFGLTRATKREAVVALETEISESYRSPSDVAADKQRAPATIQEELDELYSSARFQFLIVLILGVPVGLGLGRIRR